MKRTTLLCTVLVCCMTGMAQETGNWRAESSSARAITGDVTLSSQKISINFSSFTIARIRALDPAELSAVFDLDSTAGGTGSLYRLEVPASTRFLHRNTLCGADDTHWMVTYASGHALQLTFFSSQKPPLFTPEAIANSTDLCGTFSYAK